MSTSPPLRLAVFDVDGTLIDSEHDIVSAMTGAWAKIGLGVPSPESVRGIIGLSLVDACAALLPWATHTTHRAVAEAYKDSFKAMRLLPGAKEPLFPGVIEALDRLEAEGWLLGIATGKSRRGLDAALAEHGLTHRFVNLQTADDNPSKPHPAMLLRAAAETGVNPGDMVMIGDTAYDMAMAVAAGATAIGVSWGYQSLDSLNAAGAHAVIDTFETLPASLAALTRDWAWR
jgi:phosphoglycolate phosphatase